MKTISNFFWRMVTLFFILVFVYLGLGIALSIFPTSPKKISCEEQEQIYLLSNGVHVDLVLPKSILDNATLRQLKIPGRADYVSFGWGDKGFYLNTPTWSELQFGVTAKAIFIPSETVIHVDHYTQKSGKWQSVELCESQYGVLVDYILNSFDKDEEGKFLLLDYPGYNETDKFYAGLGKYYFMKTCNNWTNKGMKQSKVKTALWSPFAFGVMHHHKEVE